MIGAIAGDIIGSMHETKQTKTKEFPLFPKGAIFTDDSIMSIAVAEGILRSKSYIDLFHRYFSAYPNAGYGGTFFRWCLTRSRMPYNSWGNGAAMRVSPVGYAFDTLEEVLAEAKRSASVTHDHPEGIRGAQATAASIFLARTGHSKDEIRDYVVQNFHYNLSQTLDEIRPTYGFDVSCQGSVPQSIISFLESTSYEDTVRNAISLGGDADTMGCISGGIAEAFYGGVPSEIRVITLNILDAPLRRIVDEFCTMYVKF